MKTDPSLITRRSIETLLYLNPEGPRPRHIEVPSQALLKRMHAAGWITSPHWDMRYVRGKIVNRRPEITEKGKVVIALIAAMVKGDYKP